MVCRQVVTSRSILCVFITLVLLTWLLAVKVYMSNPTTSIRANEGIRPVMMPHVKYPANVTPEQVEAVRRQVVSGVRTTAAFLRSSLRHLSETVNSAGTADIKALAAEAEDRLRVIQFDIQNLDHIGELTAWRETEAASLSQEVQERIHALQNPPDCASAKKIVCNMSRYAGAGSLIHHLVYCIMAAYGSGSIFVLQSKGWMYSRDGWEVLFQPLSRSCVDVSTKVIVPWPGNNESEAVMFPDWDKPVPKPPHQPMAVPKDIALRLQRFHEKPSDWWVGQFISYLMRFQPQMQQTIDKVKKLLNYGHPIVGVHVRRTDKRTEARLYPLEEYMTHVENYYLGLDLASSSGTPIRRRVFLASEVRALIKEAKAKYPHYEFLWHKNTAQVEKKRYSVKGLKDLVVELYLLSHSDHLVCTFSSNVCRLAYEMMQSLRGDAPSRVISLDTNYFFHQAKPRYLRVRFPHRPERSAQEEGFMQADAGQVLTAANPNVVETGYTKIVVPDGGKETKFLPDYKVCEVLDVVNVTLAQHVPRGNGG